MEVNCLKMNKKERLLQRIASETICEWTESGSIKQLYGVDYNVIANAYSNLNEFYSILAPLLINGTLGIYVCKCLEKCECGGIEKVIHWLDTNAYLETQFSKN